VKPRRRRLREPAWTRLDDEALLDMRLCDLRLSLVRSGLDQAVLRLYEELRLKGIRFRPHVWLSEEWFSPDGIPGIAMPFYLAHPRLQRLERRFMREVEGGNDKWLMRILRHETGHAIDTAFGLRRRKTWRDTFGKASRRYPSRYFPRPASRRFVLHLGHWYAQSHPTEDFAETFAVWLPRNSRWRSQYAGWPALRKLEYVDATMRNLQGKRAVCLNRDVIEPLSGTPARCANTIGASSVATNSTPRALTIVACCACSAPRRIIRTACRPAGSCARCSRRSSA